MVLQKLTLSVSELVQWHKVGMASPLPQFGNTFLTDLWKLASAFHPLTAGEGKLNIQQDKYTLSLRLSQSHPFSGVCTITLLLKGPIQRHPKNYSIACEHWVIRSHLC